jgi:hypothetical protein
LRMPMLRGHLRCLQKVVLLAEPSKSRVRQFYPKSIAFALQENDRCGADALYLRVL